MSLREECFITPLSYTAHIPARHPAAKPYHMAPAFHVKVLVHNTHTFSHQAVLSPGSRLADARCWCQWELRGLAAVDVYRLRWPPCCRGSLFAVSWLERRGVYKRSWEDVVFFMSELPGQRRCVVCLCIKYVLGSWARQ